MTTICDKKELEAAAARLGFGLHTLGDETYEGGDAFLERRKAYPAIIGDRCKGRKKISIYAIAKNEESVADRWCECVGEADEVCVLDTGSTDRTVEILKSHGVKVVVKKYAEWSFSKARNDSMKLVSDDADILFTLDLDETIAPGWRRTLEDAWIKEEEKGNKPVGCHYKYIWSFKPDGTEGQSFSVRKIHAKGVGAWHYRCHELLEEIRGYCFFLPDFVVEHHQNRQTARSHYFELLEKDAREMPDDDRSAYYYARELMYNERWIDAIQEFKRHLMLPKASWHCERASSMRNIANCYEHLGDEDRRELWLWKAAMEDPTNREAYYWLGEMAIKRRDYRTALQAFQKCVAIEHPSLDYISIPLVWGASPYTYYAQALWFCNQWEKATEMTKKAMSLAPDDKAIREQYEGMMATRKRFNR